MLYALAWIVLVIEATRRTFGWFLPALTIIFIMYMMFGRFTPGIFTQSGVSFTMVVEHLYLVPEGMFNFLRGFSQDLVHLSGVWDLSSCFRGGQAVFKFLRGGGSGSHRRQP